MKLRPAAGVVCVIIDLVKLLKTYCQSMAKVLALLEMKILVTSWARQGLEGGN